MHVNLTRLGYDPEAREAFLADPRGWLSRNGVAVPPEARIEVYEDSDTDRHVLLPENWTSVHPDSPDSAVNSLIRRAAADESLRARLLADPDHVGEVAREAGLPVPEHIRVHLHPARADDVQVLVPAASETGEMSDADLELVTGGKGGPDGSDLENAAKACAAQAHNDNERKFPFGYIDDENGQMSNSDILSHVNAISKSYG